MHDVTLTTAARSHAKACGTPVILLEVSIHDGEAISRLPDVIPPHVCSDLFDGPQMLGFDTRRGAVEAFNEIVRSLVASRFECAYAVSLIPGEGDAVIESNIDRRRALPLGRHAFAIDDGAAVAGSSLSVGEYEAMPPSGPLRHG